MSGGRPEPAAHRAAAPWRCALALCAALVGGAGCSSEPGPLPPDLRLGPLGELLGVDERIEVERLSGPVDVLRDEHGRVHLYASSLPDALRLQGYMAARDRGLQLDLLRRMATGRMAAAFGHLDPSLVETDIAMRHVGLARTADALYGQLDPEARQWIDAYADGVTQLFRQIRDGRRALPEGLGTAAQPASFVDFTPVDSLAILRLQLWLLSYSADRDIELQELLDAMRSTFSADDPDAQLQRRTGLERDILRFEPADPATTVGSLEPLGGAGPPSQAEPRSSHSVRPWTRPPATSSSARERRPTARVLARARGYGQALERVRSWLGTAGEFGSNAWAIAPELSASGRALIASDPHLGLTAPALVWPVSLHVSTDFGADEPDDFRASGVAVPGIPGIALGHNRHVAWGATVAKYDVTDVYVETLSSTGDSVRFEGQDVALETIDEVIEVRGGDSLTYTVAVVPHHGPVIPTIVDGAVQPLDPAAGALSARWTGLEPTSELRALIDLMRARDVGEAREALRSWQTGPQSWVLADTAGDILWTSHATVPVRADAALAWNPTTYEGLLPCLLLPGEGTAEWTGSWGSDEVPWARNPLDGYLATANNDPLGGTIDNDPSDEVRPEGGSGYLSCAFAPGYRQGRLRSLIEGRDGPLAVQGLQSMQADVRSPLGALLVPPLLFALENAEVEHSAPGLHPTLATVAHDGAYDLELMSFVRDRLARWQDETDFRAASGVDPETSAPLALPGDPLAPPATAQEAEARAAQATLLFNAWLVRLLARTLGDEMQRLGHPRGTSYDIRALIHLVRADPATLATYDPATQDSALWDDMSTESIREGRQERMVRAMLDALAWLSATLGPDLATYRWGALHTVRFDASLPELGAGTIPAVGDDTFPRGFPRHGDSFVLDACPFALGRAADEELDFSYHVGPVQRFVAELAPSGPRAHNALAGGAVWDSSSPHFADQAEQWRTNQTHPVPFHLGEVIDAAESRIVALPPR